VSSCHQLRTVHHRKKLASPAAAARFITLAPRTTSQRFSSRDDSDREVFLQGSEIADGRDQLSAFHWLRKMHLKASL
jgi:hypothetical protein